MEYVLETSALTKRYRGFTALDSLTVSRRGQSMALWGGMAQARPR